jgi:hypothetical protein
MCRLISVVFLLAILGCRDNKLGVLHIEQPEYPVNAGTPRSTELQDVYSLLSPVHDEQLSAVRRHLHQMTMPAR